MNFPVAELDANVDDRAMRRLRDWRIASGSPPPMVRSESSVASDGISSVIGEAASGEEDENGRMSWRWCLCDRKATVGCCCCLAAAVCRRSTDRAVV